MIIKFYKILHKILSKVVKFIQRKIMCVRKIKDIKSHIKKGSAIVHDGERSHYKMI